MNVLQLFLLLATKMSQNIFLMKRFNFTTKTNLYNKTNSYNSQLIQQKRIYLDYTGEKVLSWSELLKLLIKFNASCERISKSKEILTGHLHKTGC